jgi:hypothetical protein
MNQTQEQYQAVIAECRALFIQKNEDYGTAWRVLRPSSITDQIFIKAARIRSIDTKQTQKINDDISVEFIGIVNYCLMALILLDRTRSKNDGPITRGNVIQEYDTQAQLVYQLMLNKNHDYDEVWRSMRVSSMTDLILMKIVRVKEIEDKAGKTLISEGIEANYMDMMNYAIFALILLTEAQIKG